MRIDLVSQIVFCPLAAALLLALVPRRFERAVSHLALVAMGWTLGLSLQLFARFSGQTPGVQFETIVPWIPSYGISYHVGVDGISLVLIVLTALLSAVALLSSHRAVTARRKEFVLSLLLLETAMIGTFAALDLFLFYVFWEAMLIPMYVLIGVFGGERRIYATLKFFLFTMAGSVLMLVAILAAYLFHETQFGFYSTDLEDLMRLSLSPGTQAWLFLAFLVAFAVKLPLFPFHTWLPDAHVEAPTAGSVILAGVLLKFGGYGILRFAIPLFPSAAVAAAPYLGLLGLAGIIYGAYLTLAQQDMKKLVAYSSVSHMGFVALGLASLTSLGLSGAVFQMLAHGLSTGALFLLVGMLYERRHSRMLEDFGGLAKVTPRLAAAFFVILLASVGLPGLCGFVGEFLILLGAFAGTTFARPGLVVAGALLGIVLGAAYMLILYERVFLGEIRYEENRKLADLSWVEGVTLAFPIVLAVYLGVAPGLVLDKINPAVEALLSRVRTAASQAPGQELSP